MPAVLCYICQSKIGFMEYEAMEPDWICDDCYADEMEDDRRQHEMVGRFRDYPVDDEDEDDDSE